jgi:putative transposase
VNHKRLCSEERLGVRRRGARKPALGTRAPMIVPQAPNQRSSVDFAFRPVPRWPSPAHRCRVDDGTRECLALVADASIAGSRVARELDELLTARGKPHIIVSDHGTELTSEAILGWPVHRIVRHKSGISRQTDAAQSIECPTRQRFMCVLVSLLTFSGRRLQLFSISSTSPTGVH